MAVCHICTSPRLEMIEEYRQFKRVTSDCRPWNSGGQLAVCHNCGCLQALIDNAYVAEINEIYSGYQVYYQADGSEQRTFEQSQGESEVRSQRLLRQIQQAIVMPAQGKMLDVGCGNGNLLKSFIKLFPSWEMAGLELDSRHREAIEKITGVAAFYCCQIEDVKSSYDFITMLHSLEHIIDPVAYLKSVREKLLPDGMLLIQVPEYLQNPFELMIADHCSHFSIESLKKVVTRAGFKVLLESNALIPKEITLVLGKDSESFEKSYEDLSSAPEKVAENARNSLLWLAGLVKKAEKISDQGPLGVFGTSIAGVWLASELADLVKFFVDEDPARIGTELYGRMVIHPEELQIDSQIILGFPYKIAEAIHARMTQYSGCFHLPPEMLF